MTVEDMMHLTLVRLHELQAKEKLLEAAEAVVDTHREAAVGGRLKGELYERFATYERMRTLFEAEGQLPLRYSDLTMLGDGQLETGTAEPSLPPVGEKK